MHGWRDNSGTCYVFSSTVLAMACSMLALHCPNSLRPALSCRSVRPYGVCTLLATYGKEGPQLYLVEPSGTTHVSELRHGRLQTDKNNCLALLGRKLSSTLRWTADACACLALCFDTVLPCCSWCSGTLAQQWARGGREPRMKLRS